VSGGNDFGSLVDQQRRLDPFDPNSQNLIFVSNVGDSHDLVGQGLRALVSLSPRLPLLYPVIEYRYWHSDSKV